MFFVSEGEVLEQEAFKVQQEQSEEAEEVEVQQVKLEHYFL
jgi:hypothetical protein